MAGEAEPCLRRIVTGFKSTVWGLKRPFPHPCQFRAPLFFRISHRLQCLQAPTWRYFDSLWLCRAFPKLFWSNGAAQTSQSKNCPPSGLKSDHCSEYYSKEMTVFGRPDFFLDSTDREPVPARLGLKSDHS